MMLSLGLSKNIFTVTEMKLFLRFSLLAMILHPRKHLQNLTHSSLIEMPPEMIENYHI